MQIEKNMYIRTKKGYIAKIKEIHDDYYALDKKILSLSTVYSEEELELNDIILKEDIKKASYNIIDLIEVGDYVNGFKITRISGDFEPFVEALYRYIKNDNNIIYIFYEEDIKSIVTKEQFESMEYKVK